MENIENYMLEQDSIKSEFDAFCDKYGLRKRSGAYVALLTIFANRRQGKFYTPYESLSDYSTLELAKMLKQLSFFKGKLSVVVGSVTDDYTSPFLVEVLKKSLEDALQGKVKKVKDFIEGDQSVGACMVFYKPHGKDRWKGYPIKYPEGCTFQDGRFSDEELDFIITIENNWKKYVEDSLQGNLEKWEGNNYTRIPDLGFQVEWLLGMNLLPPEWNTQKQYCFIADFLFLAGYLDFKSASWKESYNSMVDKDKSRMVRYWIQAYRKTKKK